jgi:hypothetical protein
MGDPAGKLPVFISWSLPLAGEVARILRGWLPRVIQDVYPWVSHSDIEKGKFWHSKVINSLESSTVGIAVVTPANVDRPWMNFEAGAMARAIEPLDGVVMPLLINMGNTSIHDSPLNTLQVTRFEKDDFYQLVEAISTRTRSPLSADVLREEFDLKWPKLHDAVERAISEGVENEAANAQPAARPVSDVLEDVLSDVRTLRLDMMVLRGKVSPRNDQTSLGHRKEAAILREVSGIIEGSGIGVYIVNTKEAVDGTIYVLLTTESRDKEILDSITEVIQSIPKYRVLWAESADQTPEIFENATVSASKAPPTRLQRMMDADSGRD